MPAATSFRNLAGLLLVAGVRPEAVAGRVLRSAGDRCAELPAEHPHEKKPSYRNAEIAGGKDDPSAGKKENLSEAEEDEEKRHRVMDVGLDQLAALKMNRLSSTGTRAGGKPASQETAKKENPVKKDVTEEETAKKENPVKKDVTEEEVKLILEEVQEKRERRSLAQKKKRAARKQLWEKDDAVFATFLEPFEVVRKRCWHQGCEAPVLAFRGAKAAEAREAEMLEQAERQRRHAQAFAEREEQRRREHEDAPQPRARTLSRLSMFIDPAVRRPSALGAFLAAQPV